MWSSSLCFSYVTSASCFDMTPHHPICTTSSHLLSRVLLQYHRCFCYLRWFPSPFCCARFMSLSVSLMNDLIMIFFSTRMCARRQRGQNRKCVAHTLVPTSSELSKMHSAEGGNGRMKLVSQVAGPLSSGFPCMVLYLHVSVRPLIGGQ